MDILEIRKVNLITLIDAAPSSKSLADRLGLSSSQVSQYKSGTRKIKDDLARKIEANTGKPAQWLDTDHTKTQVAMPIELAVEGVMGLVSGLKSRGFDITQLDETALESLLRHVLSQAAERHEVSTAHIEGTLSLVESIVGTA